MNKSKKGKVKKLERNWYCYVCGKVVNGEALFWSLNDRTDRVFISCFEKNCYARLSKPNYIFQAKENKIYNI